MHLNIFSYSLTIKGFKRDLTKDDMYTLSKNFANYLKKIDFHDYKIQKGGI